jgi:hypothetical protein
MFVLITAISALTVLGVARTIRTVANDGPGRVPTRQV